MERKKRSKGSVWECCYANKMFGTFEEEMKAYGQKWVTFCTHTHTHTHAAKLVVRMWPLNLYIEINNTIIQYNIGYLIHGTTQPLQQQCVPHI